MLRERDGFVEMHANYGITLADYIPDQVYIGSGRHIGDGERALQHSHQEERYRARDQHFSAKGNREPF